MDQPGVPITAKLIANLLVAAGANRILTLDLHAPQIAGFFDIPMDLLSAIPVMVSHIRAHYDCSNRVICSPDIGGMKMASTYANALDCPLAAVVKRRFGGARVETIDVMGDVDGRDILLVDDIAETGETLVKAANLLKERGALSIGAAVVHGLLIPSGWEQLRHSPIDFILTTNSTPVSYGGTFPIVQLDMAPLLGGAVERIHSGDNSVD
jgi:ribose-phosphate pyrophosphokinase